MTARRRRPSTVVLKLGGELLEEPQGLAAIARAIAASTRSQRLVVVHGGGKEIDGALAAAGIAKRQVDGVRVTDAATLRVVVAVLAGSINTRLVAAVNAAGGRAVGLTGADAGVGPVRQAAPHLTTSGERVDLGFVGEPLASGSTALLDAVLDAGFVPIIACIGASRDGSLFNVNADTFAGRLASRLSAARLVMAGSTPGVLDDQGRTISTLDARGIGRVVRSGTATAGMVAKLQACRRAIQDGVGDVTIVNGRAAGPLRALVSGLDPASGTWTRIEA